MPKTRQESFRILQLPENASEEEVKRAYKQKARELHPDKNPDDPNATEKFQELSEAYQRIVSGRLDEEELPDDFFIDPFELFFKVMLIRQMQREQARRRFVRSFGGLFFEEDDDEEDSFEYPNFGFGFPFGGFAFTRTSYSHGQRPFSAGYRQARAEERTKFNKSSGKHGRSHRNSPDRQENPRCQNKSSRDYSSNTTDKSEKKSKKTNERKQSTKSEDVKENVEKNLNTPESGEVNTCNTKGNEKTATKPKKKLSQQTSNAWKKGKKGNKGGKKTQPQSGIKKTSTSTAANGNNDDIKENTSQPKQDFQEREVGCARDTDEPEQIQTDAKSEGEKVSHPNDDEIKSSTHINTSDVEMAGEKNDGNKSKKCDNESERNMFQASVKQNVKSVDAKLEDIEESSSKLEEMDISEETSQGCTVNNDSELKEDKITSNSPKSEFCVPRKEGSTMTGGARPKVKSEQTSLRKDVSGSSNSVRLQEPKKNNKKKKYVNPKFQNLQKISSDPRLSDLTSKQQDTIPSTQSEEKNLVYGKGFRWNKKSQTEAEGKVQRRKNNSKEENSTKSSQMKQEEAEEVKSVISEEASTDQEESTLCDNSPEYNSSRPNENREQSIDELYGNLKCKKSKTEGRKQNQSKNQYYFANGYAAQTGPEHSMKPSRKVPTDKMCTKQDHVINYKLNSNSINNCYQSNQNYDATANRHQPNFQGSYLQSDNPAFHQNIPGFTTFQNIKVENTQNYNQEQNQRKFSVKSEQEDSDNKTKTDSWIQRELKRQQLYNITPKNAEEEQIQLERALAMSREQYT